MVIAGELALQQALVNDYEADPMQFNEAFARLLGSRNNALDLAVELISPTAAYSPDLVLLDARGCVVGVVEVKLGARDNLLLWETVRPATIPTSDQALLELYHHVEQDFAVQLKVHRQTKSCCWLHRYEPGAARQSLLGRPGISQFDAYRTTSWASANITFDSQIPVAYLFFSPTGRPVNAKWALRPSAWAPFSWSQLQDVIERGPRNSTPDQWRSLAHLGQTEAAMNSQRA